MKVFVVLKNNDFCEGRGPMVFDKVFRYENTAQFYANAREPYGNPDQFYQIVPTELDCSSVEELIQQETDNKKEKALAKLTDEEKELLGL